VVGVELNIPLFSGGAVSARTRQVAARLIQAQAEMDARVDEVLLELNRQLRLQQSTTLRVKALEQAVESSRVAVDATIKSTAAGVRTNLDVLNARERLVAAESELADARYAHLLAFLRLRFNAGVLTEDDLLQLAGRIPR
jgi:protease secretion system outer membrane protein